MTAQFTELAVNLMAQRGCSWEEAWAAAKSLYPQEFAALAGGTKVTHMDHRRTSVVSLANEAAIAAANDPKRQAASKKLHALANERFEQMRGTGMDYADAYAWAKANHPALTNEANAPVESNAPTFNPQTATMLGIAASSTKEVFDAAWAANGGQCATLNAREVFKALVRLHANKNAITPEAAGAVVANANPILKQLLGL